MPIKGRDADCHVTSKASRRLIPPKGQSSRKRRAERAHHSASPADWVCEVRYTHYDWFAGLSDVERDRRFRERFDQMDSNHDGVVDPAERAAWHDKQRAFFGRGRTAAAEPAAARQPR